jgi:hypothetical protein
MKIYILKHSKNVHRTNLYRLGLNLLWLLVIKLQVNSNKTCVYYNYTKLATYETDCGEIWNISRSKS